MLVPHKMVDIWNPNSVDFHILKQKQKETNIHFSTKFILRERVFISELIQCLPKKSEEVITIQKSDRLQLDKEAIKGLFLPPLFFTE